MDKAAVKAALDECLVTDEELEAGHFPVTVLSKLFVEEEDDDDDEEEEEAGDSGCCAKGAWDSLALPPLCVSVGVVLC
jgi:hypothetical protein